MQADRTTKVAVTVKNVKTSVAGSVPAAAVRAMQADRTKVAVNVKRVKTSVAGRVPAAAVRAMKAERAREKRFAGKSFKKSTNKKAFQKEKRVAKGDYCQNSKTQCIKNCNSASQKGDVLLQGAQNIGTRGLIVVDTSLHDT